MSDSMHVEGYVRDSMNALHEMFKAAGHIFEQENVRPVAMIAATSQGVSMSGGKYCKGIKERRVVHNLKAVSGDEARFR